MNMPKQPFACGECNRILPDPEKRMIQSSACPVQTLLSPLIGKGMSSYSTHLDAEVARRLNVTTSGAYALKVNIR